MSYRDHAKRAISKFTDDKTREACYILQHILWNTGSSRARVRSSFNIGMH